MKRWRFETNRISSVATAQPQSQKPVFDFDLTWWPDLWWPGIEISHKVWNSIVSRYWKNGGAARRRFFAIREKPEGRAFFAPPPPVRVLRGCLRISTCLWMPVLMLTALQRLFIGSHRYSGFVKSRGHTYICWLAGVSLVLVCFRWTCMYVCFLECKMRVIVRMNVSLTISSSGLWSIIPNK